MPDRILRCVYMCFSNGIRKNEFHDAVGMDSDDEKVEPIAGKRVRKETASAARKLEKDGHDGKSKKIARVLVEEMIDDIFVFLPASYIVIDMQSFHSY